MLKKALLISFIIISPVYVFGQEEKDYSSIRLPVNLFDTFTFDKDNSGYVRAGLYTVGPALFIAYGFSTWEWNFNEKFIYNPETHLGDDAVHGGADKYGHLYAGYIIKRVSTFLFKASGSTKLRANIEGALLSEIITLGNELGDGFSKEYGFDPYDVLFNNIGIAIAMLLDFSPVLDRIFAVQIEYYPTKDMREKFKLGEYHDLPTDYGGTKFMLATKFAGIPYVSLTPLRYIDFDFGYFSRGFDEKYRSTKTRNIFFGLSINFSIAFGDLLPVGYASSSIQSFFNYIHLPWDYEVKRHVYSEIPKEDP